MWEITWFKGILLGDYDIKGKLFISTPVWLLLHVVNEKIPSQFWGPTHGRNSVCTQGNYYPCVNITARGKKPEFSHIITMPQERRSEHTWLQSTTPLQSVTKKMPSSRFYGENRHLLTTQIKANSCRIHTDRDVALGSSENVLKRTENYENVRNMPMIVNYHEITSLPLPIELLPKASQAFLWNTLYRSCSK